MATSSSSARGLPSVSGQLTQVNTPINTASADTRNVTRGTTTLFAAIADNQQAAAGNTQIWIKLYDDVSNTWTPGTTLAYLGFPVEAWTSADDQQADGTYQVMTIRPGLLFEKGISVAATKEAGDLATNPPATDAHLELVHS